MGPSTTDENPEMKLHAKLPQIAADFSTVESTNISVRSGQQSITNMCFRLFLNECFSVSYS